MKGFVLGLLFSTLIFSCATAKKYWTPGNVEQLTLFLDQKSASLIYPYCGRYTWLKKKCDGKKVAKWDLTDEAVRKQFKYFSCKHEGREW